MIKIESFKTTGISSLPLVELVKSEQAAPTTEFATRDFQEHIYWMGFNSAEELYVRVQELRDVIEGKRDALREMANIYVIPEGWSLEREMRGAGSTYYLLDAEGNKQCVIKPNDEDVLLMNNPKQCGSLELEFWPCLPFYENVQTAVACYKIAELMGIEWITPNTELGIIDYHGFHLFGDTLPIEFREKFNESTGLTSREKLVSMQEFCNGALPFDEVYHDHLAEEKPFLLDQHDYEAVMVFEWLTGECDGHMGNLMAVPREDGKWGVIKVDNNLSLPEQSVWYNNVLAYFSENAAERLSPEMLDRITNMPIEEMEAQLKLLGKSESCRAAFLERCEMLKRLAGENLTIAEIEKEFNILGEQNEYRISGSSTTGTDHTESGGRDEIS